MSKGRSTRCDMRLPLPHTGCSPIPAPAIPFLHLKKVAVPVRLAQNHIGQAIVLAARTRPKFIGGDRPVYDETLKEGYPDFQ